jgi:hypothetical protein
MIVWIVRVYLILLFFLVHKQKQVDQLVPIIDQVLLLILENHVQLIHVDDDLQQDEQLYYMMHR